MNPIALAPAALLLLTLTATACSGDDGSTTASDPAAPGAPADPPTPPPAVPASVGEVRSAGLPTVMDTGTGAELCLGAIAESYPPQCGGPRITNWDWAAQDGVFDQQGQVRWGTFAVTGRWDGSAFTVTSSIPGPLYDPMMPTPVELPQPTVDYSATELDDLSRALSEELPGYQGSYADDAGHVLVDVVYDDGSLQSYADEAYGDGVVVVNGALVDA